MPRAVIVGGAGQIGLATARRLLDEAWDVTIVSRRATALPGGCRHAEIDARDAGGLRAVIGTDTDVLLSCVAFDATDAECLAQAGTAAGRIVVVDPRARAQRERHAEWREEREAAFRELQPDPLSRLVVSTGDDMLESVVAFFRARMGSTSNR